MQTGQTGWISGLTRALALGLVFVSHAFAQSSPYNDPRSNDPWSSRTAAKDPPTSSLTYSQQPYASQKPPASSPYHTPFGLRQSTAGAITGALLGAASGALIGNTTDDAGPGAAIGAGVGAASGYLIGRQIETRATALTGQHQLLEQQRQELARNSALLEELKRRRLEVRETERGVVVNLPDVLFTFDSIWLTEPARSAVAHIATTLRNHAQGRRVSIEGHTDALGSESYNMKLSQGRAQAVAHTLQSEGVYGLQLITHGYGEKYPIAPNRNTDGSDNPAGRAKNRRVEVVIENT